MVYSGVFRQGGAYTQTQLWLLEDMQKLGLRFLSEEEVVFLERDEGDPENCILDALMTGLSLRSIPRLPIEVDGVTHGKRELKDWRKDELLVLNGYRRPLRIPDGELRSKKGRRKWLRQIILTYLPVKVRVFMEETAVV